MIDHLSRAAGAMRRSAVSARVKMRDSIEASRHQGIKEDRPEAGSTVSSAPLPPCSPAPLLARDLVRKIRLLGGVESARSLSAADRRALLVLKAHPKVPEGVRTIIERAEKIWEHDRDNDKAVITGADPARDDIVMSGDPFDRAHNVRDAMRNLRPAAFGGKRVRGVCRQPNLFARPRGYIAAMMRAVTITIEGHRQRVLVGPDSYTEIAAEHAEEIKRTMGVDLVGRSLSEVVREAYQNGGHDFLRQKAKSIDDQTNTFYGEEV